MHWVSISPLGSQPSPLHIRGEVTGTRGSGGELLLEIGNHCHADSELLALCALAPEIREFLERFESPLAEMLLEKWDSKTMEIHNYQRQPDKPAEQAG